MKALSILAILLTAAAAGAAQGTVTLTIQGTGSDLVQDTSFRFFGDATLTGFEKAVLSGSGLYSGITQQGGTILASGTFALVFPSGGSMVGTFSLPVGLVIPSQGNSASTLVDFIIIGGTGKFESAKGQFLGMNGVGTTLGSTGVANITGTGTLSIGQRTLPQVAFGGGWYTALYFSNLGTAPASFPVSFFGDSGSPLTVSALGGTSANVSLPPGGSTRLELPNSGPLVQGYATMKLPEGVIGYGVFRQTVPGVQDQEAVVPLSNAAATSASLSFDDSNFTTAVAIVNPSAS